MTASSADLEDESLPRRIEYPGVVGGAGLAGVQAVCLPGQLAGGQGAGVGQRAVGLPLHSALLLPVGEIPQSLAACRILDPLQNLELEYTYKSVLYFGSYKVDLQPCHEVGVGVGGQYVVHPLLEHVQEPLVSDQPGGFE